MHALKLMTNISCFMILAGLVPAANAAQVNGKLQVKVNIGAACELKSEDKSVLDFGSLNNLNDKDHDEQTAASTGIEIQCSKGIAYKIGLGYGLNPSNSHRQMSNGGSFVSYDLYRDSARTLWWGRLIDTSSILSGVGNGVIQSYPVYGRIPKQATPATGAYSDTVSIEVSF